MDKTTKFLEMLDESFFKPKDERLCGKLGWASYGDCFSNVNQIISNPIQLFILQHGQEYRIRSTYINISCLSPALYCGQRYSFPK